MASTYSTNLKIELIATGEQAGTWGTTTNTNLGTALEQAIVGKADVTMSSTSVTLSLTNTNALQDARAVYLNLSGTPGGAADLIVPAIQKPYIVKNGSNQQVTIKVTGQTGVAIPAGKTTLVYNNGTDVVTSVDYIPALALGTALPVASGGTGATTSTGSGAVVLANSPTLTTPNLGTPSAATLTNATGLPLTTGVTGTLPVANGGTGATSLTANNVLLGNGTSAVQVVAPSTNGNVLQSNGTTWVSAAPPVGAIKYDLYTANSTWTCPVGVSRIRVVCIAGGGGGGGSAGDPGGHGGKGGLAIGIYTVTPGTGYSVTVGAGGAAGTGVSNGSSGGSSSLGSLISATGGAGGISNGNDGADGAGSNGITANASVSTGGVYGSIGVVFAGRTIRPNAVSSTAAQTWSASINYVPGAAGLGETQGGSNSTGGTGGAIYIEYVG